MADTFDPYALPEVDGDDDENASEGAPFDPRHVPDVVEDASEPPAPRDWWEDLGLGAVDGLTLNHGAELGHIGERAGNALADVAEGVWGTHEIDGMAPTKTGESDLDLEELYALARESPAGKVGHAAGLLNTGAAMSALAPLSIGGQALFGGASGGLATGGDTGYDPAATATGAATGALLGGLGGALGKGVDAIRRWLGAAAPEGAQAALPGMLPTTTNADRLARKLAVSLDDVVDGGLLKSARKAILGAGVRGAQAVPADALRGTAGALAAGGPQTLTPLLGASKASAQDYDHGPFNETTLRKPDPWRVDIGDAQMQAYRPEIGEAQIQHITPVIGEAQIQEKAYAGAPAMTYSMKTVLSSGDSGLPPSAQRDLTSALLSGDEGKIDAINFRLQQRYPSYSKRLQDQLKSLSEE